MPLRSPRDERLRTLAEPVCLAHGVDLVDVRLVTAGGRRVLRVLIDRDPPPGQPTEVPGSGVTLADCTAVSRDLGAALDLHEDLVSGRYDLEVGSPGVERPLVRREDFDRFRGREARVATARPLDGRRKFQGVLRGVEEESVLLEQDGAEVRLPLGDITKANLVHRFV